MRQLIDLYLLARDRACRQIRDDRWPPDIERGAQQKHLDATKHVRTLR